VTVPSRASWAGMSVLLWKADVGAAIVLLVNIKQSAIFTARASLCIGMLYLA